MRDAVLLGIDFSGSADQWRASRATSGVWIAAARPEGAGFAVTALMPVQRLDGLEPPFARLSRLLATGEGFAAIDAPLAIPKGFGPSPTQLWAMLDRNCDPKRPFGRASALLDVAFNGEIPTSGPEKKPYGRKILRDTETLWSRRGVATRSTLWAGPRGGAAFSVAAMTLLARHPGPVWPFRAGGVGRCVIEGFPAAQLQHWGMSPKLYASDTPVARANRQAIVQRLVAAHGLTLSPPFEALCLEHVDALDAVLCCYAALAVATGRLAVPLGPEAAVEGHIAVHV